MKDVIKDNKVAIIPSQHLIAYINKIKDLDDAPDGIRQLLLSKTLSFSNETELSVSNFVSNEDYEFVRSLQLEPVELEIPSKAASINDEPPFLSISDVIWIWNKVKQDGTNLSLNKLFSGCELRYPQNEEIPRSEELEKRCDLLRRQQENRDYKAMIKNIDNVRKNQPEDTIAYQIKQINREGIAIIQFIITVIAAFAFGLEGIHLMVGPLPFGFRLLLGIIFALIVAIAEIYFLAKKLNEEFEHEVREKDKEKHSKLD